MYFDLLVCLDAVSGDLGGIRGGFKSFRMDLVLLVRVLRICNEGVSSKTIAVARVLLLL